MNHVEFFKALSNKTRLQILNLLKEPEKHFPPQEKGAYDAGVCVGHIQQKVGLTQSTISEYLSLLQRTGLITATRVGQWTYYKRNEEAFQKLAEIIQKEL
ncbi:ArsR/SmtB family transcription factor [Pontibacter silvestris]|uniref:ArsR/SmtB family transcription factor n=1 Tax=Pontibacter silvestris TaxID=2305183 RepID=A0ABW4WRI8_9BACT|nr:metalloregulator ArsR/SmtB family transcription factor [Pontibacter silvestris]MCC9138160.1 helix-turn-helix domain-containing protein [Pontibacter silvestris]